MELAVYSQFKVDIESLVRNKVHIARNFHIAPSEIDRLPYWEYEYMQKEMTDTIKKEQEEQEKQNRGYDVSGMQHQMSRSMPKMPSMPKIGNFSMPKI